MLIYLVDLYKPDSHQIPGCTMNKRPTMTYMELTNILWVDCKLIKQWFVDCTDKSYIKELPINNLLL